MGNTGKLSSGPRQASGAIFGAAVLFFLPQLLFAPVGGFQLNAATVIRLIGTALLVALGVWARWQPRPACIIALAAYTLLLALLVWTGLPATPLVLFLYGFPELLLMLGVFNAFRAPPPAD